MWGWARYCFRNWRNFDGRAGRSEYWWFGLFIVIGGWVCDLAEAFTFTQTTGQLLEVAWAAVTIVPSLSVSSRRLHDTGHSLWWFFFWMFPVLPLAFVGATVFVKPGVPLVLGFVFLFLAIMVLIVWLTVLLARRGDPGPNRYGDPAPTEPPDDTARQP